MEQIFPQLIIYALATWRISSLFVAETGPGRVFLHIRELFGIQHDDNGKVVLIPEIFFAELLSCVWCFSLWVGIVITILHAILPDLACFILLPFALSSLSIFLNKIVE